MNNREQHLSTRRTRRFEQHHVEIMKYGKPFRLSLADMDDEGDLYFLTGYEPGQMLQQYQILVKRKYIGHAYSRRSALKRAHQHCRNMERQQQRQRR